jgi:hypothetical protein
MVIEDEEPYPDLNQDYLFEKDKEDEEEDARIERDSEQKVEEPLCIERYKKEFQEIADKNAHMALKKDLIEHLWSWKGNRRMRDT